MDCLEQKEFLQWNTRTKDYLCANFQDIWLSSKSWILDIKYAISTIKMQILNQFFCKKIHYIVVICVPSFHQPARSSSFFLAFLFTFRGHFFMNDPISKPFFTIFIALTMKNLALYESERILLVKMVGWKILLHWWMWLCANKRADALHRLLSYYQNI